MGRLLSSMYFVGRWGQHSISGLSIKWAFCYIFLISATHNLLKYLVFNPKYGSVNAHKGKRQWPAQSDCTIAQIRTASQLYSGKKCLKVPHMFTAIWMHALDRSQISCMNKNSVHVLLRKAYFPHFQTSFIFALRFENRLQCTIASTGAIQ